MSLLKFGGTSKKYGVVVDIGSGSVLVSIVESDKNNDYPNIIWSHRELAPLKNIDSLEQSINGIMTALVNASMQLDSVGRKFLREHDKNARLQETQCGISAPWAYTVTKSVNYEQEEDFEISKTLIAELVKSVSDSTVEEMKKTEEISSMDLEIVTQSTISTLANGYQVAHPEGQQAKQLEISYTNAISQKLLIDAVDEMQSKLFSGAKSSKISFILMLYAVVQEFFPNNKEVCLVDITYEATEIGIVRDGILKYCTHAPFGAFSLAREISAVTKIPLTEAFGYLKSQKPYAFLDSLSKTQREEVENIFESYVEKISELFQQTGDALSIPKQISIHTDTKLEPIFEDLIDKAAKRNLKSAPQIYSISKEIVNRINAKSDKKPQTQNIDDTALLVSAQFFHKRDDYLLFDYV